MITLQDIFNAAWQRFVVEGAPPAMEGGRCKYLCADGRRCAIGLVLPEGFPVEKYDYKNFGDVVAGSPDLWDDQIRGMNKIQCARFQGMLHDGMIDGMIDWLKQTWRQGIKLEVAYRQVAERYGLEVPAAAAVEEVPHV